MDALLQCEFSIQLRISVSLSAIGILSPSLVCLTPPYLLQRVDIQKLDHLTFAAFHKIYSYRLQLYKPLVDICES